MKLHPDIQPIGHISPRPRIDLNPPYVDLSPVQVRAVDIVETARIWECIVSTATGSNVT